jgi:hypothetical protein
MKPLRILVFRLLLALLAGFAAVGVQAAQLQIQFTGVDLEYFTFAEPANPGGVSGDIFDAGGVAGGSGIVLDADSLSFMDFLVDGVSVGTLASDIYLDTFIQDVWNIPVAGGTVQSQGNTLSGFGFDLLTEPRCVSNCWGLGLDINTVQVNYNGGQVSIQSSGAATGILQQMLPFGLELDATQPITFDFTGTSLTNLTDDGAYLTGFNLAGTGTITGTLVSAPVPAALWLFGSGLFGLIAVARSRNNS